MVARTAVAAATGAAVLAATGSCFWRPEAAAAAVEPQPEPELDPTLVPDPEPGPPEPRLYCTLPPALRLERLHRYDTQRFPFAGIIAGIVAQPALNPPLPRDREPPLQDIHQRPDVQGWLAGARRNNARAYAVRRNIIDKRFKAARPFAPQVNTEPALQDTSYICSVYLTQGGAFTRNARHGGGGTAFQWV